jgi:hypothetical protein
MGQFDDTVKCPKCGTWGAKKSFLKVRCVNPACGKYDAEYAEAYKQTRVSGKSAAEVFTHLKGKADPSDYTLKIRYRNFRGDEIIYSADPTTVYQTNEHVVARLAPTGKRVSFNLPRIQNREEVEALIQANPQPNKDERRVLHYHLRRGTTSRLFEEIREKYPNYKE